MVPNDRSRLVNKYEFSRYIRLWNPSVLSIRIGHSTFYGDNTIAYSGFDYKLFVKINIKKHVDGE